jgi:hypothetical protein
MGDEAGHYQHRQLRRRLRRTRNAHRLVLFQAVPRQSRGPWPRHWRAAYRQAQGRLSGARCFAQRRRRQDTFVKVPLAAAAELAEITGTRKSLAWLSLLFAAWEAKGQPFVFSNKKLIGKCTRELKRRTLSELEAAGWIRVEQKGKQAPLVTVLKPELLSTW